jgi:alpha,alpha-trehalase
MVVIDARRHAAVVFDMDGVITDTAVVHRAAWKRTLDAFLDDWSSRNGCAQHPFSDDDYYAYVDGKHRDDGVASFLRSRGIDLPRGRGDDGGACETVWGLANRKNVDFQRILERDGVVAFESSVALVRTLQEHGVGTAVISASRNAARVLEAAGILTLFPVRVDGTESARLALPGKPDPAVFVEAARRVGAAPDRAVVVEDAVAGVRAGRAGAFALVIGVDRVGHGPALLANGADVVVHDLAEVAVCGARS